MLSPHPNPLTPALTLTLTLSLTLTRATLPQGRRPCSATTVSPRRRPCSRWPRPAQPSLTLSRRPCLRHRPRGSLGVFESAPPAAMVLPMVLVGRMLPSPPPPRMKLTLTLTLTPTLRFPLPTTSRGGSALYGGATKVRQGTQLLPAMALALQVGRGGSGGGVCFGCLAGTIPSSTPMSGRRSRATASTYTFSRIGGSASVGGWACSRTRCTTRIA